MTPQKTWMRRLLISSAGVALLAVSLVALNVVAALVPLRLDVTEENLFTLSEGSRNILHKLEEPVTVKFYYSGSRPNIPPAIKTYARKVRDFLEQYDNAGGDRLRLEVHDPKPDTETEEWAVRYGLQGVNLPAGEPLYFGMVALSGEKEVPVPFFDPRREKTLEYDITQAISRATQEQRQTVGVVSYLPVRGQQPGNPRARRGPEWAFVQELRKTYRVQFIDPPFKQVPEPIDILMLVHPKFLPDPQVYAVDQFLMRGGRLVLLTDPHARTDPQPPQRGGMRANFSSVPKLYEAWGIEFGKSKVVGDQELATRVSTRQQGVVDFPLWISFREGHLNRDNPITGQLEEVTLIDAGALSTSEDFEYTFTPLLTTSQAVGAVDNVLVQMAGPVQITRNLEVDNEQRVLAALVSGRLKTAFPDGAPSSKEGDQPSSQGDAETGLIDFPFEHKARADEPTSVLVVGDADFVANQFSVEEVNLFGQRMHRPINDNLNFVLNGVEFLSGSQELIKIRSRGTFSRPFTTVQAIRRDAQAEYKAEEKRLRQRLEEVQNRLGELEQARGGQGEGGDFILTPEMVQEVEKYRKEEQRTRQALREVRKVLREDINRLGNALLAINLLAVPLMIAVVGFIGYYRRIKRSRRRH